MTRPVATDCLAGTLGHIPTMIAAEQDLTYFSSRCGYFQRQDSNALDGGVHVIGDSRVDGMDVTPISSYAIERGIGADTMRGVLNRINQPDCSGAPNSIHRAAAATLCFPVNDPLYEDAINAVPNYKFMIDQIAPAMTGKWVVSHIINVGYGDVGAKNGLLDNNTRIGQINEYIDTKFAGNPNVAIVNVNPTLAPMGTLLSTYALTGDKVHLNKAGCDIWRTALAAALAGFGIG